MTVDARQPNRPIRGTRAVLGVLMLLAMSNRPLGAIAGVTLRPDLIGAALAVPIALVAVARGARVPRVTSLLPLAAFVTAQLLAASANYVAWPLGVKFGMIYVGAFAYVLALLLLVRDASTARWAFTALLVLGVAQALWGMLAFVLNTLAIPVVGVSLDWPLGYLRARGLMSEANLFSSLLLVPFALGLWRWGVDHAGSWVRVCVCAVLAAGLVLGHTRAAWVAGLGVVLVWVWRQHPARRRVGALAASVVAALALSLASDLLARDLPLARAGLYDRTAGLVSGNDSPLRTRREEFRTGLQAWRERPVLGHGPGSVNRLPQRFGPSALPREGGRGWVSNATLFILVEAGLVGLAAALWLLVRLARDSRVVWGRIGDATLGRSHEALVVGGAATLVAWQATHGLWQMYGYLQLAILLVVHGLAPRARSDE